MERKSRNKWNTDDIIIFLDTFRKFEVLWNGKHQDYYNKNRRELALSKLRAELISYKVKVPDTMFLRTKIKNIKSTYRQELQKILHSEKKGTHDGVYEPRLCWFKTADAFLREVAASRPFSSNLHPSCDQPLDLDSDEMIETEVEIKHEEICNDTDVQDVDQDTSKKCRNRIKAESEIEDSQATNEWQAGVSMSSTSVPTPTLPGLDEYDAFGVHIANQLRQLPTRSFVILQEKIQSLITKERLDNMHNT